MEVGGGHQGWAEKGRSVVVVKVISGLGVKVDVGSKEGVGRLFRWDGVCGCRKQWCGRVTGSVGASKVTDKKLKSECAHLHM